MSDRGKTLAIGERFGRLTVLSFVGSRHMWNTSVRLWLCACECGATVEVAQKQLTQGSTKSCGCLKKTIGELNRTHGEGGRGHVTPEYNAWMLMRRRCNAPSPAERDNYKGRGIMVCERWSSYEVFLADVGRRPTPRHSLDRINNDGNYEPGNVRWATRVEQAANKRNTKLIEFSGERHVAAEWGRITGIPGTAISRRLRAGWEVEKALTQPFRSPA